MASTYENDLRLEEMATGENSGSWGTKTNTNLELIADAFSYGTETIANADTTITIADGAADAARSLALKINSSEDLTTTRVVTLAPNTTSKVWIIENNTSGGQVLTISAGSGSNITLANGTTKIIATDGIGAGSNVVELTQDIAIADMSVDGILSLADGTNSAPSLTNTGDTNTGLYFPAADEVGITVGGTQVFKADSTGANVTGTLVSDGLTVDGNGSFTGDFEISGLSPKIFLNETDTTDVNTRIRNASGNLQIQTVTDSDSSPVTRFNIDHSTGDITFYDSSGNASFVYDESAGSTFNEQGADRDFRVESDSNANMLFVDAGNNRVGIGAAPSNPFEVNAGSGNAFIYTTGVTALVAQADAAGDTLILQTTDTSATNGPNIKFRRVATGADNDGLMQLGVNGFNDTGTEEIQFFRQRHFIIDASDGTEDGAFDMFNMIGGSLRSVINHDSIATIFNDNSVDIDFRVESDSNTHALFVDAGNDKVIFGGDGTINGANGEFVLGSGSSSTTYFSIRNNTTSATTSASSRLDLGVWTNNGAYPNPSDSVTGLINFMGQGTDNAYAAGSIESFLKTAGNRTRANTDSQLRFYVKDQTSTSAVEYFRLSGDEKSVVFNQTSADRDFRVESDGKTHALFVDGTNNYTIFGSSSTTNLPSAGGIGISATGERGMILQSSAADTLMIFRDSGTGSTPPYIGSFGDYFAMSRYGGGAVRLGINETAPQSDLHISGGGDIRSDVIGGKIGWGSGGDSPWYSYITSSNDGSQNVGLEFFTTTNAGTANINHLHMHPDNGTIFNETGADLDFRIESDSQSHLFQVDAGTNQVRIGTQSSQIFSGSSPQLEIKTGGTGAGGLGIKSDTSTSSTKPAYSSWTRADGAGSTAYAFQFYDGPTGFSQGNITVTNSATSYNTSSDYRLKENVVDLTGATERVKQLQPKRFNFIANADTTVDGFLAHEAQAVVPEAITGEKDAVDADGNPEYQSIDQSKLVPLLVATIKELEARIAALENA